MKLYIDTTILKEIEWAEERGLIDGVTTNPTLLSKADRKLGDVVNDILETVTDRLVHIEVVSQTTDEIIEEAKTVSKLAKNVVVKIPMSDEGLLAVRELKSKGVKTNVTLVFSVAQALLAARAGTDYISLYDGKTGALAATDLDVAQQVVEMYSKSDITTEVILGGISDVTEVEKAAHMAMPGAAVPFKVLVQMYRHDLTEKGVKQFLVDWEKVPK